MVKYFKKKKVIIEKSYTGTHEELHESYNNNEPFERFIGGIIATQAQLDEPVVVGKDEEGNDITKKMSELYHWFETNDGRFFLTFMPMVTSGSWISPTSEKFYELSDKYGIDNVLTKSVMESLIPVVESEIL